MTATITSDVFLAANSAGDTQLRRSWTPATPPKSAILMVHGIGEHSGRYDHVGRFLAEQGHDVLMADNRGFGQSAGRRAHIDSFDEFIDDIDALLVDRRTLGVPVVLFGHSLGGLMAATYLVSGRSRPDIAVLSAPALAANVPLWQRVLAPIIGRILPTLFLPDNGDGTLLSRDPEVQRGFVDDPLVIQGATAGLGKEIFATMTATSAALDRITVPTYVIHGDGDELVPPSASESLAELPGVTRRVWTGLRHECMNEPEQLEVLTELNDWLETQLSGST